MPQTNPNPAIRIALVDAQGKPLGGTVDLQFKSRTTGQTVNLTGQDASKEIQAQGLQLGTVYDLTVILAGSGRAVSQTVSIPASVTAPISVVVAASEPPTHKLQGTLIFDNGLPAAGIKVRLYAVGFGGQTLRSAKSKPMPTATIPFPIPQRARPRRISK